MRRRIDPERQAAANRVRSKKQSAYWASPEGEALKAKMREERKGKQTEVHKQAMIRAAQRQLGIVEAEEGPGPGWVTDEERAIAAREGEPPAGRS